jgi:hypothetical protein
MNGNKWFRQFHRWTSIAFTVAVLINIVVLAQGQQPPVWVGLLALIPLALLMITGLYLFALPYVARWRSGSRQTGLSSRIERSSEATGFMR